MALQLDFLLHRSASPDCSIGLSFLTTQGDLNRVESERISFRLNFIIYESDMNHIVVVSLDCIIFFFSTTLFYAAIGPLVQEIFKYS